MTEYALIYPMFAMVVLTFYVLVTLFRSRVKSVKEGKISGAYFRTYRGEEESDALIQLSRHFTNLFEAPVLFYVVCLAAMISGETTTAFQFLAWAYVSIRAAHAYIHIGRNRVQKRLRVYFFSWIVLLVMWVYLIVLISFSH